MKILPPSLSPERVKVDDFYAARSGLIPPLPWSTFSPPFSAGEFGDPLSLALSRQRTFWNRKTLIGSTPGRADTSTVLKWFRQGDQRRYHVPCPTSSERPCPRSHDPWVLQGSVRRRRAYHSWLLGVGAQASGTMLPA